LKIIYDDVRSEEKKESLFSFLVLRLMIRRKKEINSFLRNESKQTSSMDGFLMDLGGKEFFIMNPLC